MCGLAVDVDQLEAEVAALSSLRSEVEAVTEAVNAMLSSLNAPLKELYAVSRQILVTIPGLTFTNQPGPTTTSIPSSKWKNGDK